MKLEESFTNPEEIFGPKTKILNLKRNQFVLEPNKTEMHIYYVISGSVASFIEKDGEEVCMAIHTKGNFFSEYSSFIAQTPSQSYSKTLQNCKLAAINYHILQAAYDISKDHERKGRLVSEQLYQSLNKRVTDLLTLDAEARYLKFIEERPDDILEIPLKYIASYLGMTPVSLSRIRKKISN